MVKIRDFAYKLYKVRWCYDHISERSIESTIISAFEEDMSVEEYIEQYGFNNDNECYASYDEFIDNEYQNSEYMIDLFNTNSSMLEEWKKDLKKFQIKPEDITVDVWNTFIDEQYNSDNHWDYAYICPIENLGNIDGVTEEDIETVKKFSFRFFSQDTNDKFYFFHNEKEAMQRQTSLWAALTKAVIKHLRG